MFYLLGSLFVLLVFSALLLFRPDLRRQGLIPALLFTPYGPISEMLYFRDYWLPEPVLPPLVMFGQMILIEDCVFAFAIVGLMSVAYDVTLRKKPVEGVFPTRTGLAVALSLAALLIFIGLSLVPGLNSILVSAAVAIVFALPMLCLRPDLWPVALGSSLILGCTTFVFYMGILSFPGAVDYLQTVWKLPLETAAWRVFGLPVPLTELLWAVSTAFYYSIVYKFAVGCGYQPKNIASYG